MCSLFPCISIFRGFFLLKSVKKMFMCIGVKNRIVTCEKCMSWCEKGISEFWRYVAQKHTAELGKFSNFLLTL